MLVSIVVERDIDRLRDKRDGYGESRKERQRHSERERRERETNTQGRYR